MHRGNVNISAKHDLQQLASSFGVDVQRLFVFFSLYENAFVQGALSDKVKHLIALAIGISERASETIAYHMNEALQVGASREEIRESVTVAVLLAGVPSLISGAEALATLARLEAEQLTSSGDSAATGTPG